MGVNVIRLLVDVGESIGVSLVMQSVQYSVCEGALSIRS